MPIRKRKTVRRKRLKKPSELEKGKAEISKLRSLIRRRTKELKSQIVEKEALLLEKDKELASLREVMEEKVKELESSLVEKGEEILTLRQAEERNRELETKVRQLETELGRKALVVEKNLIGRVTHYYSHLSVGIVELTGGKLKVGDVVHIKGTHTDFTQTVDSMQIEHENVSHAEKGKVVGIKVKEKARKHDLVFGV